VELAPLPDGGTELIHEIWMVPRHVLGRVAASWELTQKIGKNLDTVYHKLAAAVLAADTGPRSDAFEPAFEPTPMQRKVAARASSELCLAGFDATLVTQLVEHLLYQPTKVLERVR